MSEPILSRDQILKIVRKTLKENNDRDKLSSDTFMKLYAALEAAWLEKICEKPDAWAATSEEGAVEALGFNQSRRFDTPLYALTRSKP